LSGIQWHH